MTDNAVEGGFDSWLCICRPQYYKLIEECVTQIVLHRSGVDPDFRHTKRFSIDVEPLLGELIVSEIIYCHIIYIQYTYVDDW